MMITDYDRQAGAFLNSCKVTYRPRFVRHGFMEWDSDGKQRDIFYCEFSRQYVPDGDTWKPESRQFGVVFGQSLNDSTGNGGKRPTAYDVLACLEKNDPGAFKDWCDEFGYNTDSLKARKTWRLCVNSWKQVKAFFTPDELEQLREIQ